MNRLKNDDIEWLLEQLELRVFSGHVNTPAKKRFTEIVNDSISPQKDLRNLYYLIWDSIEVATADARYNVFDTTISFSVRMSKTVQPNVVDAEILVCLDDTEWIETWNLDRPDQVERISFEIKSWLDNLANRYEKVNEDENDVEREDNDYDVSDPEDD